MATPNLQVISYARDMSLTADKFRQLDALIRNAWKDRADAVAVAAPEVLGDTYDELVGNLRKLADANLLLAVVPSKPNASERN